MKLEDIISAVRENKKVQILTSRKIWVDLKDTDFNLRYLVNAEYKLVKEKVNYYPVLYKDSDGEYKISNTTFPSKEVFLKCHSGEFIKIIKEIPELIKERVE